MSTEAVTAPSAAPARQRVGDVGALLAAFALVGLLFVRQGASADTILGACVICVLVAVSRIDIERRIIPDLIVLPAWAIALVANLALHPGDWWQWLLASVGCGLLFLVFARASGGLGMGDVKLVAFLGAALGGDVVPALMIGTATAALVSLAIILRHGAAGRKRTIPYGPFLAAGAIAVLIFL